MISLFLDTSNFRLILGVVNETENKVLTYYNEKLSNDLSVKIFEVLENCTINANILPDQIDKIYCVTGPGSFTGVRIGVTIAKVYAWAKNIKLIPISSLEVLASSNYKKKYNLAAIDARRNCVYAGLYDNDLNPVFNDEYISIENLNEKLKNYNYSLIADDEITGLGERQESNVDILKVINKNKNKKSVNPHSFNPSYLKITEAEANLKNKKND